MELVANPLPGLLAEIEAVAGRAAAETIALGFGGTTKEFPSPDALRTNPARYERNWLVKAVGADLALRITSELFPRGGRAEIPSGRKIFRRQFVQDNAATLSVPEMALCLEMTERAVRRIKASLRAEGAIE